tara:strand:+ start:271 stop:519 length:249 start_codon:yes stop_codon:yes gene_type:complete
VALLQKMKRNMIKLNRTLTLEVEVAPNVFEDKQYGPSQMISGEVADQDDQLATVLCDNGWVIHNLPTDSFGEVQVEKNRAIA